MADDDTSGNDESVEDDDTADEDEDSADEDDDTADDDDSADDTADDEDDDSAEHEETADEDDTVDDETADDETAQGGETIEDDAAENEEITQDEETTEGEAPDSDIEAPSHTGPTTSETLDDDATDDETDPTTVPEPSDPGSDLSLSERIETPGTGDTTTHIGGPIGFGVAVVQTIAQATSNLVAFVANPLLGAAGLPKVPMNSPADWAVAGWVRREFGNEALLNTFGGVFNPYYGGGLGAVLGLAPSNPTPGTVGPNLLGHFIGQTVVSLLTPVRTLMFDLFGERGLPGQTGMVSDDFPGACNGQTCNPSSDIPIPQPSGQYTFINLTGESLVLDEIINYSIPSGDVPTAGFVLEHGRSVEMTYSGPSGSASAVFKWNSLETDSVMYEVWGTDYGGRMYHSGDLAGFHYATPTPETGETYPVSTEDLIQETFALLPEAGTAVTVAEDDPIGQVLAAGALCAVVTCDMDAVGQEIVFSDWRSVGNVLFNEGTQNATLTYETGHKTTSTSGFQETLKIVAGLGLSFDIFGPGLETAVSAVINQSYGTTWAESVTYSNAASVEVPTGEYGVISVQTPMYDSTINISIDTHDVVINIPGTKWLSPVGDPNMAAPRWRTETYIIGSEDGPINPDSTDEPSAPDSPHASLPTPNVPTPEDIDAPTPEDAARPNPLHALAKFVEAEVKALLNIPASLIGLPATMLGLDPVAIGVAGATRGFEIVNLTPFPVTIEFPDTDGEDWVDDEIPPDGYVLAPFEMVRAEMEYEFFSDNEGNLNWTISVGDGTYVNGTGHMWVHGGQGQSHVSCRNESTCMDGGYDSANSASVLYITSPVGTVADVTDSPNLASAVTNLGCEPDAAGRGPAGCHVQITKQELYYDTTRYPSAGGEFQNDASTKATHKYTVTLSNSAKTSWSTGGGIKISQKTGALIVKSIDIEAYTVYQSSLTEEQSEKTSVTQVIPPGHTGIMGTGEAWLRTYGDWTIDLPNATIIVRGEYVDSPALLDVGGPLIGVTDYPTEPDNA